MKGKTPSITTTTTTFTSAEVISDNDELLLQILIALPAKSLIRFQSVTKHWRSLISDASFRLLHTRRHRSPDTFFLLSVSSSQFYHLTPSSKNLKSFHFNFDFDGVRILQSCNGLLLVESGYQFKNYYVYNPTTGESRDLLVPKNKNDVEYLFLAFDPLKSPHYSVICLYAFLIYEIEVYDSETRKWKHYQYSDCNMHPHLLEWVYSYSDNSIYALMDNEGSIVRFDIEKHEFGKPFFDIEKRKSWKPFFDVEELINGSRIAESFGHVYRISKDGASDVVVHEITLKNDEWSSEHLFGFDITHCCPALSPCQISFLGFIRKDNSLVFSIPGKIMACHFSERRFEELLDLSAQRVYENGLLQFGYGNSCQFVDSLAPV